jgi:hypothetical protein
MVPFNDKGALRVHLCLCKATVAEDYNSMRISGATATTTTSSIGGAL